RDVRGVDPGVPTRGLLHRCGAIRRPGGRRADGGGPCELTPRVAAQRAHTTWSAYPYRVSVSRLSAYPLWTRRVPHVEHQSAAPSPRAPVCGEPCTPPPPENAAARRWRRCSMTCIASPAPSRPKTSSEE